MNVWDKGDDVLRELGSIDKGTKDACKSLSSIEQSLSSIEQSLSSIERAIVKLQDGMGKDVSALAGNLVISAVILIILLGMILWRLDS
jgi:septal ring factor EnvC (AmiA/AmiB activator)